MKKMCLGFIISRDLNTVMLIRKTKGFHKGLWNGVGGHIENGEEDSPQKAMSRECLEEVGIFTKPDEWLPIGTLLVGDKSEDDTVVYVYAVSIDSRAVPTLDKVDSEYDDIVKVAIGELPRLSTAPHVTAFIHSSIDKLKKPSLPQIQITEIYSS